MEIVIPDTFTVTTQREGQGEKTVDVHNEHTGTITLPDAWTGRDLAEWPAGVSFLNWEKQWQWAKKRVVDWNLDGLPSNPMQLKDNELPWHLLNFITQTAFSAMDDYGTDNRDSWYEKMEMPDPWQITAAEMLSYRKAYDDEKEAAGLVDSYRLFRVFVRKWPDGVSAETDSNEVDLSLIAAVVNRGTEIVWTAIDLGNLPAPLGGRSTKTG